MVENHHLSHHLDGLGPQISFDYVHQACLILAKLGTVSILYLTYTFI